RSVTVVPATTRQRAPGGDGLRRSQILAASPGTDADLIAREAGAVPAPADMLDRQRRNSVSARALDRRDVGPAIDDDVVLDGETVHDPSVVDDHVRPRVRNDPGPDARGEEVAAGDEREAGGRRSSEAHGDADGESRRHRGPADVVRSGPEDNPRWSPGVTRDPHPSTARVTHPGPVVVRDRAPVVVGY